MNLQTYLTQHLQSEARRLGIADERWGVVVTRQGREAEIRRGTDTLWTTDATCAGVTTALEGGVGPTVWSS